MTISAIQCAMARKCLRWSQHDLSSVSDVSLSTISGFERDEGFIPTAKNLSKIRRSFEKCGIEFLEGDGVRRRCEEVRVYRGQDGSDEFFQDMFEEINSHGGDILFLSQSNDLLTQPCDIKHRTLLSRLECLEEATKSQGSKIKCLITKNVPSTFLMPSYQMRQIKASLRNPSSYFVYGDKYVIIHINGRSNFIFTVFKIPGVANDFKLSFLNLWEDAVLLDVQSASTGNHGLRLMQV